MNHLVEALARFRAHVDDGDDWPTNAELGGNLTGTRDDELRAAADEDAREFIDAFLNNPLAMADLLGLLAVRGYNGAPDPWQEVYDRGHVPQIESVERILRNHAERNQT